jgi:hypothetical protein
MTDKYPASPRLLERLKLQVMAIGTIFAASAWVLLVMALAPLGIVVRAGRMLLHVPRADRALQPE